MVLRAGAGRERLWARSPAGNGIASLVPPYPYTNATLDMAFTANAYTYGDRSLDLDFTSGASNAFYFRESPAMPSYSSLTAFLTGIGGTFTRASSGTYFDATGTMQTAAANVPRLDYNPATLAARGYLREPPRTNSIPNNSATGAVAGSPGTLPTGVFTGFTANQGTAVASVALVGVESGITYWDVNIAGVTTGVGALSVLFTGSTAIVASSGQIYAASLYTRLSGGTAANITGGTLSISEYTSGGTFVAGNSGVADLTASTLAAGRSVHVRTLSGGGTVARVQAGFSVSYTAGAVNATYRIGLPQLELVPTAASTASSPIVTTSAAVARAADVFTLPTAGWLNAAAGTFYVEGVALTNNNGGAATMRLMSANDGSSVSNTRIMMGLSLSGGLKRGQVINAGVTLSDSAGAAYTPGVKTKMAIAYASGDYAFAADGAIAGTSSTAGALPTMINLDVAGDIAGAPFSDLHGWIERIFYVPSRLANATLQSITT